MHQMHPEHIAVNNSSRTTPLFEIRPLKLDRILNTVNLRFQNYLKSLTLLYIKPKTPKKSVPPHITCLARSEECYETSLFFEILCHGE